MQIASQRSQQNGNGRIPARFCPVSALTPLLAIIVLLAASSSGRSQSHTTFAPPRIDSPTGFGTPTSSDASAIDPVTAARRRAALNVQRQKQIVADSEKLLKLTRELNDEVAAGGSGSLDSDQLDKLNEIEKLARRVKEQMLDEAAQPSAPVDPSSTVYR